MYSHVIRQISSETTFDAGVISHCMQRWRWIISLYCWSWWTTGEMSKLSNR